MTLHQLKVFSTVAREKSITLAAQKLHMTQPAVSIQLKQLESHYGLYLIEIIGKKIHLTEAGKKIHEAYLKISEVLDEVNMEISALKGSDYGKLKIAVVSTAKYFIPTLLGKFHQQYSKIEIQLTVSNREDIIRRLQENKDDLVVLSQLPKKMNIIYEEFLHDKLVVPAHPKHSLVKKKNLLFKSLSNEPFIIREKGSGTRMIMEKLFKKHQINPKLIMELGSGSAVKQAIMAGFGISIVSKMSIEQELALKKLAILDIKGFPLNHPWYVVYPKGKKLSPSSHNFLKFLKAI